MTRDRGERYEVTALNEKSERVAIYWTNDKVRAARAAAMAGQLDGWSITQVRDRKPDEAEVKQ